MPLPPRTGYDVTDLPPGCPGGEAAERAKHKRHGGETPRGTTPANQQVSKTDSQTTPKASQRNLAQGPVPMPVDPSQSGGGFGQGPQTGFTQPFSTAPGYHAYQNPNAGPMMGVGQYTGQNPNPLVGLPGSGGFDPQQYWGAMSNPLLNQGMQYGYCGGLTENAPGPAMGTQNFGNAPNPQFPSGSAGPSQMQANMFGNLDNDPFRQSQTQATKTAKDFKTAQQYAAYVSGRPVPKTPSPPPGRGKKGENLYIQDPKDGEPAPQSKLPPVRACAPFNRSRNNRRGSSGGPSTQGRGGSAPQGRERGGNQFPQQPGPQRQFQAQGLMPAPYFPPGPQGAPQSYPGFQNQTNPQFRQPNQGFSGPGGQYGPSGFSNFGGNGGYPGQGFQQSVPGFAPQGPQPQGFGQPQQMPYGMTAYSSTPAPNAERSAQIAREFQQLGQQHRAQRPRLSQQAQTSGMQRPMSSNQQRQQSTQQGTPQLISQTRINAQDINDVSFEPKGAKQGKDQEMKDA